MPTLTTLDTSSAFNSTHTIVQVASMNPKRRFLLPSFASDGHPGVFQVTTDPEGKVVELFTGNIWTIDTGEGKIPPNTPVELIESSAGINFDQRHLSS